MNREQTESTSRLDFTALSNGSAAVDEAGERARQADAARRAWIERRLAELRARLVNGLMGANVELNTEILALDRELRELTGGKVGMNNIVETVDDKVQICTDGRIFWLQRVSDRKDLQRIGSLDAARERAREIIAAGQA